MGKSAADEKILSFNDVVLRRSDLDILSGQCYLNDRIIEFYFSYLQSSCHSEEILLVPPCISFWVSNCPDTESLKDFLQPLKLFEKKLVIFSVNDNDDVSVAEGGSHWSILVFDRDCRVFVHHDSWKGMNTMNARQLYKTLVRFIDTSSDYQCNYIEHANSPQQVNGYDCGLYVTAIARTICDWYEKGAARSENAEELWFPELKATVTPVAVGEMRREILDLIKDFMAGQAVRFLRVEFVHNYYT